jgi:gluconokinase
MGFCLAAPLPGGFMQFAYDMIGVDIGTTSTKAVRFDAAGAVAARQAVSYPLRMPSAGAAEQEPERIFQAVVAAIRGVAQGREEGRPLGLAFGAAMHSLIALAADGRPLTNSITWADNRAAPWAAQVLAQGGTALYQRTGTPIHPMSPLVKLVWLKNEHPAIFRQAARFVSIKEYVCYRLFGRYLVDYAMAAATGMLDLARLDWDAQALQLAGISSGQLSDLVPTTYVLPGLPADTAQLLALPAATAAVIGASDGVLSNLGLDAIRPGVVALSIGTSGAVRTAVDRPVTDPGGRLFCYPLTGQHWVLGGAVNSGGIILAWARDQLAGAEAGAAQGRDPLEMALDLAATAPPGAAGLLFHPYLAGERAPLWDAQARGSFYGLNLRHTKAHLLRAVAEGVLLNLRQVLALLEAVAGRSTDHLHASGGFAQSAFLRQLLADVFDRPVIIPQSIESACRGAAILGLYALQAVPSLDVAAALAGQAVALQPDPGAAAVYRQVLPVFTRVQAVLAQEYAAVARLQETLPSGSSAT